MSRGFKRSYPATAKAHASGWRGFPRLRDHRSFVSVDEHLILYGPKDVGAARERAVKRATKSRVMRCQNSQGFGCGLPITDDAHEMAPNKAEMHHLNNKQRCDCDHNLEMWCRACHSAAHTDGRLAVSA